MNSIVINASLIHPDAQLPQFAHSPDEEAGMDLFAAADAAIDAGDWAAVSTGVVLEIPPGYEGQVRPRSGLALRHGVTLLNSPGTIDPGYRGEIRVILINHGPRVFQVQAGDRIAQLVIASYAAVKWNLTPSLKSTARGDGGFGSTGV